MTSFFLNPALLWFLPLAAVPILLHLLTLHRLKTVELSTFRFLFDSYVQQRRRMRFLEALLAILRTLFLLFLIFVVSRPVVSHWDALFGTGSGRDVVMLVDTSASMNARSGGVTGMERAKGVALAVAERLKPDDRLTLVRVAAQPAEAFSRFSSDVEAIRDEISALAPTASRANFLAALTHVFGPQGGKRDKPVVYVFTDCQASGWREVSEADVERLVPGDARLVVVNVGAGEPLANRAVAGTPPREQRAIAGLPILLRPRVVNHSTTEPAEVPLSVIVDEKEVARTTFTLKPGASGTRDIVYVPREPGPLRGRFEIPTDAFPDDDTFLFALTVTPQVKVLLVNGFPTPDRFEDETLYLQTALSSTVAEETSAEVSDLLPNQEFLRSLEVREINEPELNVETLREAKVVVLANCGALSAEQYELLRQYVAHGGGLLVLPGDKVNADSYNAQFFAVPGPQGERLTPAVLAAAVGDAEKADAFERFARVDFAHPVLSVFEDPEARYLSTAYFYRRFPLTIPAGEGNAWLLAQFSDGAPALVESRFRDGVVLLAAFPLNARWSNLPLKPEFVPLVLRLVSHLEHRPELEAPSVVAADGAAEIGVSELWAPAVGKVTDAEGRAEPIALERSGSRMIGAYQRTSAKGYYTVEVTSGAAQQPRGTAVFAVNLAGEESKFDAVTEEQLREWLPSADLTVFDASVQAEQLHGPVGDEREVWRPLIGLMFVVIAVEFLLATLSGGKTGEEEPLTVMQRIRAYNPSAWAGRMTGAGAVKEGIAD